ncbi:hypothetical protein MMC27_004139 [Xylographa pallens]|nr:hypothetical protein [Xylographa pallens]
MVFGFIKRATASNASLRVPIIRVTEPRCADDIDKSHLERFVATRVTIEGGRRKKGGRPVLFDEPRSILLEMVESDLPTLLALRRTSKTMESFVNLKVKRHLQERFETLDIVYPLQIRQGPSILTFGESLNWIGEYVKKLNVTVIPRLTDANCFQTVQDIELTKSYWHMIAEEFFGKDIAGNDYGTSFEAVLRSLPFVKHIEIILAPLPTMRFDHKGLQIEASLYSSETWHWCPLFDECPAPESEVGHPAVTHLPALLEIRLGFDAWRPVKLKKVTLTNLTFAGLLALSHNALWSMRVTKDAVPIDPLAQPQVFWVYLKGGVNINMVSFWQLNDTSNDHCVKIKSKAYKLGMGILSEWLNEMNCRKLTWTKPTLDAEKSELNGTNLTGFVPVKGPGRFRLFFWM